MGAFLALTFEKGSHVKLTWLATYKYSQIKMRRDGRSEAAAGLP